MTDPQSMARLEAIRDFFVARNARELAAAYARLADLEPAAPTVADWQQVEFAFNRLFVGPRSPVAPPFASVYLEAEPQLMGASTLKIRQMYELVGLASPRKNVIPDDHLSFELDAYRQLCLAQQQLAAGELIALRDYLLNRHLARWLPLFINRVNAAPAVPEAIRFVLNCLDQWLSQESIKFDSLEQIAARNV